MKLALPSLILLLLVAGESQAIRITLFTDIDTFVQRARDIVIAKCVGPVPDGRFYHDGLYPVDVQVISVLKGVKNASITAGKAKIHTIYPMEADKTYLLASLGGGTDGREFIASPEMSVVELPQGFRLDDLNGKTVVDQVRIVVAARRQEVERRQRLLEEEKKLLDKALSSLPADPKTAWGTAVGGLQAGLRITEGHGQRLNPGEQCQFDIVVRNVTDKDIAFMDHVGKRFYLDSPNAANSVDFNWMAVYSGPGPIDFPTLVGAGRELRVGSAGIYHRPEKHENTWDSLTPGKYRVGAANVLMHAQGADSNPLLTTGYFEMEILKAAVKSDANAETPAWGEPKNGMRIGVASALPGRVSVAMENVGKDDLMVNVGMMLANGKKQLPTGIRLTATDDKSKPHVLKFKLPGVAGRVDPFIVPLSAGCRYTLSIALDDFSSDEEDGTLAPGQYKLTAECVGGGIGSTNADTTGLALIAYWNGPAVSGETQFAVPAKVKER